MKKKRQQLKKVIVRGWSVICKYYWMCPRCGKENRRGYNVNDANKFSRADVENLSCIDCHKKFKGDPIIVPEI